MENTLPFFSQFPSWNQPPGCLIPNIMIILLQFLQSLPYLCVLVSPTQIYSKNVWILNLGDRCLKTIDPFFPINKKHLDKLSALGGPHIYTRRRDLMLSHIEDCNGLSIFFLICDLPGLHLKKKNPTKSPQTVFYHFP